MLADSLEPADEHPEARRIDVADVLEIDDEPVVLLVDQFRDRFFDLWGSVDVDLTIEIDDGWTRLAVGFPNADFDIHSACHP